MTAIKLAHRAGGRRRLGASLKRTDRGELVATVAAGGNQVELPAREIHVGRPVRVRYGRLALAVQERGRDDDPDANRRGAARRAGGGDARE